MLNLNYKPTEIVDTDGMANDIWLKYRTTGIGGSDVSAIYEISGWTTKRALYYAKIGLDKGEATNQYTLDFGHWVEPFVAQWFQHEWQNRYKSWLEKQMNIVIKDLVIYKDTMMYQHPLYKFMQANLDYRCRIIDDKNNIYEGIFECKTTSHHIGPEKWDNKKVPLEYELQCRHYMSVMNLDFTIIACLWGNNENDYRVRYIKRDYDMEEDIINMEYDFWNNNVLAKNPPPMSVVHSKQEEDAFKTYNILSRIKSGEISEIDTSDDVMISAVKEYKRAQDRKEALSSALKNETDKMNIAKLQILGCLAKRVDDNKKKQSFIFDKGGITNLINYNRVDKKGFNTSQFKEDYPDLYKNYEKTSSYYLFSVTEPEISQ